MLEMSGFKIIKSAANGEEAINMCKSFPEKPDIILMDHRMPIKDGIETTKEILQLNNNSKIIFISADHSIKETALSIGAVSFNLKPLDMESLINTIHKALQ
jgi:YesN/AraC family two-component response regulator